MSGQVYKAVGLMSGTSADGVNIALLATDGQDWVRPLRHAEFPYPDDLRRLIKAAMGRPPHDQSALEARITDFQTAAVRDFLNGERADLVGFHGQTLYHAPQDRVTWQLGDGARMAAQLGLSVVYDFRTQDVAAGGQGAPLIPLYHRAIALATKCPLPCLFMNIGGVSNVTWIGGSALDDISACDTGVGNALLDDWMERHTGAKMDRHGVLSGSGHVDQGIVATYLSDPYFALPAPKSLDRLHFHGLLAAPLSLADGAASFAALPAYGLRAYLQTLPHAPKLLVLCGGGRHNPVMVQMLEKICGLPIKALNALGFDGDATEAEGFAYLAVRSALGLPLSLPKTTGVPTPQTGGKLIKP